MSKKSYNPFKMWGSYLGAIIFLIIAILGMNLCSWNPVEGSVVPDGICKITMYSGIPAIYGGLLFVLFGLIEVPYLYTIGAIISSTIFGFFLGYGIHSLIRAIRR